MAPHRLTLLTVLAALLRHSAAQESSASSTAPAPASSAAPSSSNGAFSSNAVSSSNAVPSSNVVTSTNSASAGAAATGARLVPGTGPSLPNTAPLPQVTGTQFYSMPAPTPFAAPTLPPFGAWFSYPQPPIPATTTTADPAGFTVSYSPNQIAAAPTTREYTFNMHYAAGWPSGFLRRMTVINNQFPGPLIEANQGDNIVIHVNNNLDHPQAIHWHGIRQSGSNAMDGVPGFSQCPIPPGGSFTYRFKVPSEMGTFWYHSHYGNTMADGLVGAFVVHSPNDPLKRGVQYDEDQVLFLSDWMHDQSELIHDNQKNLFHPYRGLPFVAEPDAVLINGIGQSNCAYAQRGVPCGENTPAEVRGKVGQRIRLRLINSGAHALIRFSIDNHVLTVIEADDTPIQPVNLKEVPVGPGQRYSVVVTLNQGAAGSRFWMRAQVGTFCINPLAVVNGHGILRYTDAAGGIGAAGTPDPVTSPWPTLAIPNIASCRDLDQDHALVPLVPENAPAIVTQSWTLNSLFGVFIEPTQQTPMFGFGMNGIMYKNYINNPLLQRIMDGISIPSGGEVAAVTFNGNGAADIIINVLDPPPLSHPFHLHGRPFYIIARGPGAVNALTLPFISKNLNNPLRRDTLVIPQWSYAVIRVKLDNPGIWPLHCHIGWHLSAGKMAAVAIGTDSVRQQPRPADWAALCEGLDKNVIGPGRRSHPRRLQPSQRGH